MSPVVLLLIYCAACVVASLSGGWIPLIARLTHRRMQIAISFVSGVILGIGVLHLLPHSFFFLGSIDQAVLWLLFGFLFMFFLERFFHFHHHDVAEEDLLLDTGAQHAHAHCDHDQAHHHHAHAEHRPAASFPWVGAAIGMTLHSLIDGVALAAAVKAEGDNPLVVWAGIGALLAIVLHKPFDSLTIGTLMAAANRPRSTRHLVNALYSLVTPLGVLLFYLVAGRADDSSALLGCTLAFAAGAFVCIATSDLLPELQFHRHDRAALSIALLAGIALAWGTVFLEASGHDHSDHSHGHSHGHQHGPGDAARGHNHADEHDHGHAHGEHEHGDHDHHDHGHQNH